MEFGLFSEPLVYWLGLLFFIILFLKAFLHYRKLTQIEAKPRSFFDKYALFRQCISTYPLANQGKDPAITRINILVITAWVMVGLILFFGIRNIQNW